MENHDDCIFFLFLNIIILSLPNLAIRNTRMPYPYNRYKKRKKNNFLIVDLS